MIIYQDKKYNTFNIYGETIYLLRSKTEYGMNTVAEIDDIYYHLGNVKPTIEQAIIAYQKINDKSLNQEQINEILNESCRTS